LDLYWLAVNVDASDNCSGPSRSRCPNARNRKTAFLLGLLVAFAGDELWVDDVACMAVHPVGEHSQLYADLRSCDTGPTRKLACLFKIFDKSTQ
jgi:hypothetical protein